jgi:hydrophobic/amphiphilic exporter-1 (mainly G- bacteria), HAE1 family
VRREGWPIGPVPAAAILAILLALSLSFLRGASLGPGREQGGASCTVTVENAGVDGRGIERTITVPLEDALAAVPGVVQVRSVSEYGRSRVTVVAAAGEGRDALSPGVREAVDRVAAGLPSSAQKPRIVTSALGHRPVFIAAVRSARGDAEDLRDRVEREVKPRFAQVAGAGEVDTGGGAAREVYVRVDAAKAALQGLSAAAVAGQIARQALLAPAGTVARAGSRVTVSAAGRASSIEDLAALPIRLPAGGSAALSEIASVEHGYRERESISRVDGSEAVVIGVHSSGTANLIALSRGLRAEAARWEREGLAFDILLDRGLSLEKGVRGILSALLQAVAVVTAVLPLFVRDLRRIAALAALLPLTGLVAAAVLSVAGVSLDQYVLSGLAVGIGTILDTGIIVSEQGSAREMRGIAPSLAASLATTLIVLLPLFFLDFAASGIRQVAASVGLLLVVSFCADMLFLPAFFLAPGASRRGPPDRERGTSHAGPFLHRAHRASSAHRAFSAHRARRRGARALHLLVDACVRRPSIVLAAAGLLGAGLVAAFLLMGKDFSPPGEEDSVYARLEFEPGASIESVDDRTLQYTRLLRGRPGIGTIESVSRRGGAEMQVRFDPSHTTGAAVTALMREAGARIIGGFVYLPDAVGSAGQGLELEIRGDDDAVLRDLAREAAALLGSAPGVRQVVLNFKDPPPALIVELDRHRAAGFGVRTADAAAALRWALHGPVALKWIEGDREIDLRVMAAAGARAGGFSTGRAARADILAVPVFGPDGSARPLGRLARLAVRPEGGKIYRTDRQRTASLTVHPAGGSIDTAVRRIRAALVGLRLPPGYALEMDRQVRELDESFRRLWFALGLSAVFVFVVLAGFSDSLASPLAVLSVLPPSLAVPVIACAVQGQPLRVPVLVGVIMLSGMAVNNSILVIDEARARVCSGLAVEGRDGSPRVPRRLVRGALHRAVRARARPLLVTSLATVAGTIPLLFARGQAGGFLSGLALVVFWGMLGSLGATLLVVPALLSAAPALLGARPGSGGPT